MPPTITHKTASNWVDRGEAPNRMLRRALGHFFHRFDEADESWLEQHAVTVLGMVAADANEVQIAGYLRSVANDSGFSPGEPQGARAAAVTLWHIAKAALVRDLAERLLRFEPESD